MPSTSAKTLSPSELAKLEHAFATDPGSDAYRPLAEAYLAMGRFMEAMVVCKKGVKAHPNSVEPRLLLARVYADQGKDKKALEELAGGLAVAPENKLLLRMAGALQLKTGELETGKANLLKAYQADPQDAETQALLSQHGIAPVKATRPQASAAAPVNGSAGQEQIPPRLMPVSVSRNGSAGAQAPNGPALNGTPAGYAPTPPPQMRPPPRPYAAPPASVVPPEEPAPPLSKNRSMSTFIGLALTMAVVLITYFFVGQWRARRKNEVNRELSLAREALRHDNWDSYKKACDEANRALELNPDSVEAHGMLAYAYAIRWGEHGGGDTDRDLAERHLNAALKEGEVSSQLYAARALIEMYEGKRTQALNELQETIDHFKAAGRQSSQLYLTLGLVQMNAGDYDRAMDSLQKAQELASGDARVYAALGDLYQRTGQDALAWKNYDFAQQYEKDHPESLLGKSLLIATQDHTDAYRTAAAMLKKLLDAYPPPSPRQLATAHLIRALLISRAAMAAPYSSAEVQKEWVQAGLPLDKARAEKAVEDEEDLGFHLDRGNPELHVIKGQRLLGEGNVDGAVAEMRQAVSMDKNRTQFYLELAKALMRKPGGEKEAKAALSDGIKAIGPSSKLLVALGNVERKMGDLDGALTQYQLADGKFKTPEARIGIGSVYRERKDWDKAESYLQGALRESMGQAVFVAAAKVELGQLYEAKGEAAKAEDAFKAALSTDRSYAPGYFFYARFLASRDFGKARTTAQEYLRRAPRGEYSAEAQRLLREH